MNERIKALAEQAGMNIKTNISGVGLVFGTFEGYKTSHISVKELEKFAELIVRDCASYIHGYELFTALLNRYGVDKP
jgi:hypothetical protein